MSNYDQAKNVCITLLSGTTEIINADYIRETIARANLLFGLDVPLLARMQEELETLFAVFSDQYRILDDTRPEPWVKNAKANVSWSFWNRYRRLLEKKNYAPDTINKLDNLTDDILDRLPEPGTSERYDKRGLIVGQVQSGKTGNYIGLICKAADVGYKIIIVLAGVHNSLRSQTQLRIDEGFLGFDTQQARSLSQTSNRIGVGRINPNLAAHSLTTNAIDGDFSRQASEKSGTNIRGNDPVIITVKKNVTVLRNLLGWLYSRGETMSDQMKLIKNVPLLIIDDEADNASINISRSQVSGVNACIRAMIKLFEKSVYIGYTATPYANIFIKQGGGEDEKGLKYSVNNMAFTLGEDIFPKNFIVNIPAPSNYIGPEKVFFVDGNKSADQSEEFVKLYEIVDDYDSYIKEGHKAFVPGPGLTDSRMTDLPPSLKKAVRCFFLTCAARRARGQEKEHNSMLVHMSRFTSWQDRIADLVLEVVKDYAGKVELSDPCFLRELEVLWVNEFVPVTRQIIDNGLVRDKGIVTLDWLDLLPHLHPATAKIEVRAVHGDTRIENLEHKNIRPLDYYDNRESGLSVIAVGGNKLSRGLTLEGLTISYFLRASKMYDTLMQMGRWFGYRPGYLDLCRLFTSSEMVDWYRHITIATEEMKAEFDHMSDLGRIPAEYGLKVRTHPGSLVITAANKFRYKKIMELSFSGILIETYTFKKNDRKRHLQNYNRTLRLINEIGPPGIAPNTESSFKNHYIWQGKDNVDQVLDYLNDFITDQPSFNRVLITRYIAAQINQSVLCNWTIVLITNTEDAGRFDINKDVKVGKTRRADKGDRYNYTIAKSRLIDPRHEFIDLTDDQIKRAMDNTIVDAAKAGKDAGRVSIPSPSRIREQRPVSNGLLLIYVLDNIPEKGKPPVAELPLIGLAISFPDISKDTPIEYAVNEQFLKELNYPEELDEQNEDELLIETEDEVDRLQQDLDSFLDGLGGVNKMLKDFHIDGTKVTFSTTLKKNDSQVIAVPAAIRPEDSFPLFRAEDIERYYLKAESEFWVVNGSALDAGEGVVIAPRIYSDQAFGLYFGKYVIYEDCIAISIDGVPAAYLSALLNSVVFAYDYKRRNSGAKDTVSIVKDFPIDRRAIGNKGIETLVRSIQVLKSKQLSRESAKLASYFINVLDVAVLEIYFSEEFSRSKLSVLDELDMLPTFVNSLEQFQSYYDSMNKPDSSIKKAVYAVTAIDKINYMYRNL